MRVLMVVQRLLPYLAGAESQALGLAKELMRKGVDVLFLSTRYMPGLAAEEDVRGVRIDRVSVVRGPLLKPSQYLATKLRVSGIASRIDIVHGHCLSAASIGAASGARSENVPVLLKPSLGGRDGEMAKITSSPLSPIIVRMLKRVDRFASLGEEITKELTNVGISAERIEEVDNGVDLATFTPVSPDGARALRDRYGLDDDPIALYAGQLVSRKGIAEVLDGWMRYVRTATSAQLLVAGDGVDRELVERVAHDPSSRVRYLGVVEDVEHLMQGADLFLLPSRNESFGNALLEAMACGLPVVACPTGLAKRLDIDGKAGIVIDRPDPGAIGSAILEIFAREDRGRSFGLHARALAERYGFDKVADHYIRIYESMLAERR